jgi:outer membrane protein
VTIKDSLLCSDINPCFNGFSVRNNVERSKVFERSKIALEQQDLDLQRNVYVAFTDAKGP